jgi:hypothetical protein
MAGRAGRAAVRLSDRGERMTESVPTRRGLRRSFGMGLQYQCGIGAAFPSARPYANAFRCVCLLACVRVPLHSHDAERVMCFVQAVDVERMSV